MRANSARAAILLPLGVFGIVTLWLFTGSRMHGDFRIDEAHKIADTAFLGHLLRADLSHPDWSRHIADRTNPPIGKYLFGLSVLLHGLELPASVSVRIELSDGKLGQRLRPEVESRFRPHLLAVRRVSAMATAVTAAVLSFLALRLHGTAAALLTPALYLTQYLTLTFSTTAVYDPLLTLFIIASAIPLMLAWLESESWFTVSAAGILSAVALQTRLSGAVALLMTVAVFAAIAARRRSIRPLLKGGAAAAICLIVSTAVNPYYWPGLGRYATQFDDARSLLSAERVEFRGLEKVNFVGEFLAGDLAGLLLALGVLIALMMIHPSGTPRRDQLWFALIWCVGTTGVLLLWLPLPWPRHFLPVVPAVALLSGFGWSELLAQIIQISGSRGKAATPDRGAL